MISVGLKQRFTNIRTEMNNILREETLSVTLKQYLYFKGFSFFLERILNAIWPWCSYQGGRGTFILQPPIRLRGQCFAKSPPDSLIRLLTPPPFCPCFPLLFMALWWAYKKLNWCVDAESVGSKDELLQTSDFSPSKTCNRTTYGQFNPTSLFFLNIWSVWYPGCQPCVSSFTYSFTYSVIHSFLSKSTLMGFCPRQFDDLLHTVPCL